MSIFKYFYEPRNMFLNVLKWCPLDGKTYRRKTLPSFALVWTRPHFKLYWFPKDSFAAHPNDINNKRVAGHWGPTVLWNKTTTDWYFTPPPQDIPQAQTSLPPPFPPHSPPAYPAPPQPSSPLSFHSTTIVPSFSDILISPKTNGSRIFLSLLLLLPLLSPIFSLSLSLLHSGADERQALSRQWHSKTSGLGSSVSGYSTLLGAISLSKVWPAYSPTENPQISYYTRHTEGRHTAALRGCNECVYVCGRWIQIETSEYKKTWRYGGERKTHAWACLFMSERESELVWEAACVLEIYEQWVSRSLGRIFRKFPHREAKCVARRQTPLTNNSP